MDKDELIKLLEGHIKAEFEFLEKLSGRDVEIKDEKGPIARIKYLKTVIHHARELRNATNLGISDEDLKLEII